MNEKSALRCGSGGNGVQGVTGVPGASQSAGNGVETSNIAGAMDNVVWNDLNSRRQTNLEMDLKDDKLVKNGRLFWLKTRHLAFSW